MVRRARRRAWARIVPHVLRALTGDEFIGDLADLAFREGSYIRRNAVGNPMNHSLSAEAFGIDHGERITSRPLRRILPGQLWRYVIADAVRIWRWLVGGPLRHHTAVLERR